MKKPKVYIASPYTKGDSAINTHFQMRMFDELLGDGYVLPVVPLWTHFQHIFAPRPYQDWVKYDLEMLDAYDACLRLNVEHVMTNGEQYKVSESSGADGEVAAFQGMGKPVFYDKMSLYEWANSDACKNRSGQIPEDLAKIDREWAEDWVRGRMDEMFICLSDSRRRELIDRLKLIRHSHAAQMAALEVKTEEYADSYRRIADTAEEVRKRIAEKDAAIAQKDHELKEIREGLAKASLLLEQSANPFDEACASIRQLSLTEKSPLAQALLAEIAKG